jgi:hypothetical protein
MRREKLLREMYEWRTFLLWCSWGGGNPIKTTEKRARPLPIILLSASSHFHHFYCLHEHTVLIINFPDIIIRTR